MIDDYPSARNEIFKQYQGIIPSTAAIIGEALIVNYQGVTTEEKMPVDKFWSRVSIQTVIEEQTALAGNDLKRRYTSNGVVFVQLFIPVIRLPDYEKGTKLAQLIKTAFRGKQTENCIWFRNTRIQELPKENAWFRINVVSDYQYDEIG
jgi:hypothetical protein